jgi:hypothetical protein
MRHGAPNGSRAGSAGTKPVLNLPFFTTPDERRGKAIAHLDGID